ncbi:MAG: CaiB/BaiF CoA-transferase family protein [Marinovum algicola]|uniref:CaiB/BaiF CoA transferase family protein n=1 Tax=Roseobacteraceae TaxID=2854170 RepID=UPI0032EC1586
MALAFEGIRVLDFSQVLSGPYASGQLALQGAEVIKIERPGSGEQGRAYSVEKSGSPGTRVTGLFYSVNADKRSLTLDLKRPEARAVLEKLLPETDVIIENFKSGTMARLSLGYDWARSLRPDIIYCAITGYGQDGPRAGAPAYDHVIQAASGAMSYNGHPDTGPMKCQYPVADIGTGMTAAFAIAAALLRRARTGEGQYLDVSMFDTLLHLQAQHLTNYLNAGAVPRLMGNGTVPNNPASTIYPTRDGFIHVSLITQPQFESLCRTLGLADTLEDPRFATGQDRIENREALREVLVAALAGGSASDWEARLSAAGVPAAAIATVAEVMADPHVAHRALLARVTGADGPVTVLNPAFQSPETPASARHAPPAIGEHSDAILGELGYDAEEIRGLRAAGVI